MLILFLDDIAYTELSSRFCDMSVKLNVVF